MLKMDWLKQKAEEWVAKRFPAVTPKKAFTILSIMAAVIVIVLGVLLSQLGLKWFLLILLIVSLNVYVTIEKNKGVAP